MAKDINAQWLAHIPKTQDPVARENLKKHIVNLVNSDPAIKRLRDLIKAEYDKALVGSVPNGLDNPNWALIRSFQDGKTMSLKIVLDFLEEIDE